MMFLSREQALGLQRVHTSKLSVDDVMLILRVAEGLNGSRLRKQKILGQAFGVHHMTIHDVLTGQSWQHVTVPFIQEREQRAVRRPPRQKWLKACPKGDS